MAAPKAHRTQRRMKNGDWYMRISAGRHAGAVKLFECTGMTKTECEQQIADNAGLINERYEAAKAGLPTLATIAGLLNAWERSAEFEGKAESTKAERSRIFESRRSDHKTNHLAASQTQRTPLVVPAVVPPCVRGRGMTQAPAGEDSE